VPLLNNHMTEETANGILQKYLNENKPKIMDSPTIAQYIMTAMVVNETLLGFISRKQTVHVAPEFLDEKGIPFMLRIFCSNFSEGSKANIRQVELDPMNFEPSLPFQVLQNLRRNKNDINPRVDPKLKTPYYLDILSGSVTRVMVSRSPNNQLRGNRVTGYELTNLVNWYSGLSERVSYSWKAGQALISLLSEVQPKDMDSHYYINWGTLRLPSESRCLLFNGVKTFWQISHTDLKGKVDHVEYIVKRDDHYYHTIYVARDAELPVKHNSKDDTYRMIRLEGHSHMRVRFVQYHEYMMLINDEFTDYFSPVAILSSSLNLSSEAVLVDPLNLYLSPEKISMLKNLIIPDVPGSVVAENEPMAEVSQMTNMKPDEDEPHSNGLDSDDSMGDFGLCEDYETADYDFSDMPSFSSGPDAVETVVDNESTESDDELTEESTDVTEASLALITDPMNDMVWQEKNFSLEMRIISGLGKETKSQYVREIKLISGKHSSSEPSQVENLRCSMQSFKNPNMSCMVIKLPTTSLKRFYFGDEKPPLDQLVDDILELDESLRLVLLRLLKKSLMVHPFTMGWFVETDDDWFDD